MSCTKRAPTTQMGLWPALWQCSMAMMARRFPMCRLSAVGSNPQYTVRGWPSCFSTSWVLLNKSKGTIYFAKIMYIKIIYGLFFTLTGWWGIQTGWRPSLGVWEHSVATHCSRIDVMTPRPSDTDEDLTFERSLLALQGEIKSIKKIQALNTFAVNFSQ